jgi:predicted CXXCH cytochrome family protein
MIRHTSGIKNKRLRNICIKPGLITIFIIFFVAPAYAKVTGVCSNCHTMHNSQNGSDVLRTGSGVGWDGSGHLTGGSLQSAPAGNLLVTSCVGCHSSTTAETKLTIGSSTIPIVYNTVAPTTPLSGGNFYWVASDDTKGHNVYGIAGQDSHLNDAPGRNPGACSDVGVCHSTLAAPPSANNYNRGGCQGCHVFTYHHEDNGVYRFLKGHGPSPPISLTQARKNITIYTDYVTGVEDSDWEYTKSTSDHNFYKGTANVYSSTGSGLTNQKTVTAFCAGCHRIFHGPYYGGGSTEGMGNGSPWLRHPTDITLPTTGEYNNYDPTNNYSTEAPVAWVNPSSPTRAQAIVMCLSCHRPHGSDQPDLLRWDYDTMIVEGGGSGGCFVCHTTKS